MKILLPLALLALVGCAEESTPAPANDLPPEAVDRMGPTPEGDMVSDSTMLLDGDDMSEGVLEEDIPEDEQ